MQKIVGLLLAGIIAMPAMGQHTFTAIIKDKESNTALEGVSVLLRSAKLNAVSDSTGFIQIKNIPSGKQSITFSHAGYKELDMSFDFPITATDSVVVAMEKEEEELEEVIVQSTRTSRTIKNTPTRIETIDGEELDEKSNMRPSNVSMLLHESTGLLVQQTSATSGNASIRVQGLDGRYTQLLKDGYPTFGAFASGLSILEIPPLDLKQVEIIKGPASTLYGGGAIAGVVNFVSKMPGHKFSGDFIFNQSNIGQTNISGFVSNKRGQFGYSLLGSFNAQKVYDVDNDDFTEVPKGSNFTLHPKLFFYASPSLTFTLGNSFTKGELLGGDAVAIKNGSNAAHTYFEKNKTTRNTSTFEADKKFKSGNSFKLKQSLNLFKRSIELPGYLFAGSNANSFTDASYIFFKPEHTVIAGANAVYEKFNQQNIGPLSSQSFTTGVYIQDTWDAEDDFKIETGLRIDNAAYKNSNYRKNQAFILPRISGLFKFNSKLSSRISGGLGYKLPTLFTEQTEAMQYQNLQPLNNVTAEKSMGGTADINYKTNIAQGLSFSINQMFFYTAISKPLVLQQNAAGNYFFVNAAKPVVSSGFETNLKFIYKNDLKLFVGYTFTNAKATYLPGKQMLPLVPQSKVNLALMYEKEDNFKFGLEGYFTGTQNLTNGNTTPAYWEFGFMAQKTVDKISFYINFENFTDQRQSKYKTVANPPHDKPTFDEIWNHTEGFVWNGGIKLKL